MLTQHTYQCICSILIICNSNGTTSYSINRHAKLFSLISTLLEVLFGPYPNLLTADIVTVMSSANTPSGSDGAVNTSVVVELVVNIAGSLMCMIT